MGVEYRRLLIPRPNTFRPDASAALSLIAALRDDGWIPRDTAYSYARSAGTRTTLDGALPKLLAEHAQRDLLLGWSVDLSETDRLRYPLEPAPFADAIAARDFYFELQLHFGHDFVHDLSETIDPFSPPPQCPRGHPVELDSGADDRPFFAVRLAANCRVCGEAFDPTRLLATGRNGWNGDPIHLQGGATYRFALVIDCGKAFGSRPLHFHPALKELAGKTLAHELYEVERFA
jgi:hypothetical protein